MGFGTTGMLDEVLNQIGRRQKFILTSHARPDGDAVGSALACCQILRSMGKEASVVLSDGVPGIYTPLPFSDTVLHDTQQAPEAEAVIILECDSVARTRLTGLERHYLINIDHHTSGRNFAHLNWIDTDACDRTRHVDPQHQRNAVHTTWFRCHSGWSVNAVEYRRRQAPEIAQGCP